MFLLANFSFFLLQNENRRCQEGVKASYSYGEISFSIPDALELRTKWLVWWWLLFKGKLLSLTKVPGSSIEGCFKEPGLPEDGLPVSAGPTIPPYSVHSAFKTSLLSRNAYHASICRHAAKPQSLPVSVPAWVWESGRSPNSRWVSRSPGLISTGCLLSP